jgi:hypothetical protein
LDTLRQFTLENHRKSLAVQQFVAALSRHPAHALGSYFAVSGENPQQEIYVELCRTCGGWNFFVESKGKRGEYRKREQQFLRGGHRRRTPTLNLEKEL